jgi:uncharacterized alpha-E superfamily protein
MLSRIANSLYWLSRYLERADNTSRLIEINLSYLLETEDALNEDSQWRPLLMISSSEEHYAQRMGAEITGARVLQFLTRETENTNSIRAGLKLARENARVVRDQITKEMWETINELWLFADEKLKEPLTTEEAPRFFGAIRKEVSRFHGTTASTMMRGEAYGFYLLGTHLERADMTARILDVKYHLLLPSLSLVGSALDYYQWAALLRSLSGFEAYRRKCQSGLSPADVAGFTILERDFHRSLAFCVDRITQALRRVGSKGPESRAYKALAALADDVSEISGDVIFKQGLHEFLTDFLAKISLLSDAVSWDYFQVSDSPPPAEPDAGSNQGRILSPPIPPSQ